METLSRHFRGRAVQRRLKPGMLDFILDYGRSVTASNAIHYTVLARDLPAPVRASALARGVRDWIVVAALNGTLMTCYRRTGAARFLKFKSGRSELQRAA